MSRRRDKASLSASMAPPLGRSAVCGPHPEGDALQPDAKALDDLVRRIVEAVRPLRIVLFGSAARNAGRNAHDFDILIIMPEGTHRRRTAQHLYRTLGGVSVPFDLVVATPGDLEKHKDNIGLVYHTILREGVTLYAA